MKDLSKLSKNELFSYSTKELQDYLDTMDANGWRNIEEDDKVEKNNVVENFDEKYGGLAKKIISYHSRPKAPESINKKAISMQNKIGKIKSSKKYQKTNNSPLITKLEKKLKEINNRWQVKKL